MAVESADLIARTQAFVDGILVFAAEEEVAGNRNRVDLECHRTYQIADAVVIGIEEELVLAVERTVGTEFVEATGKSSSGSGSMQNRIVGEVAGEIGIGHFAEVEDEVTIGRIVVFSFGIPDEVAVDIGIDDALGPSRDLRATIDGEAGNEVASGNQIAGGEERIADRLGRIVFTVELIARRIDRCCR